MSRKDYTGLRSGRLTAVSFVRMAERSQQVWLFRCDCGKMVESRSAQIMRQPTSSCGCGRQKIPYTDPKLYGPDERRTYHIWKMMKARCQNPTGNYQNYGARGIAVAPEWEDYATFRNDMGVCPTGMSIEREDNNGNYEPSNCRWATRVEQSNNRRSSVFITHDGETKTVAQWAKWAGIGYNTLWKRIERGCSFSDSLKKQDFRSCKA